VTALHHLATASPYLAAFVVLLVIAAIGVLIWAALPDRHQGDRDRAIERQIATLRRHADHAVQTRPRVRANGCASTPGHLKAAPKADKPKACGGGMCHHRADCSDTYCPGRISASLAGTQEHRHAHR
jgi:hypothetical protein